MGKRWRAPARHLSGPAGSEPDACPLTSPQFYSHRCSEGRSSVNGHQVLHILVKRSYRWKKDTPGEVTGTTMNSRSERHFAPAAHAPAKAGPYGHRVIVDRATLK